MTSYLKRFSVVSGFGILMVLLIGGALVTRRQVASQIEEHFQLAHTREVLYELERTESLLKGAETGQRGLLYTGDMKYLAPFNLARGQVDAELNTLGTLIADNPAQVSSLAELRNLSHQKLDELTSTVQLFSSGRQQQAKSIVLSDRGLLLMNKIRDVIDVMEAREIAVEGMRSARFDRSIRWTNLWISIVFVVAVGGLAILAYFILREMRLREQYAEEIRQREEWFRITLTSIGDAVIATDPQGSVTFVNPLAEKLIGRVMKDVLGLPIADAFPIFNEFTGAKTENPVRKVIEQGIVVGLANHTVLQSMDGRLIPIEDSAAPIYDDKNQLVGVVLVFRDVTHERKAQDLLRKSEKLSAAARLSATVAHEINNPLEAVGNLIYLTKLTPGLPASTIDHLTQAESELARVAHITRQTLGFYRESNDPRPVDVLPILDSVLNLYSNKLRTKNVHIQRDVVDCPPVIGVPGELRQAIANLLSNAIDAVQQNGNIAIRLRCIQVDGENQIQLLIEDDGPGIAPADVQRIFEPFFTTKKDIGTGLGLYVTREILERHGGTISVQAGRLQSSGGGACFVLTLPCDPDPRSRESVVATA